MFIDLNGLEGDQLKTAFVIDSSDPLLEGYEGEVREPIGVDVLLTHPSHDTYILKAEIAGTVLEPCRRCLTPVEVRVEDDFHLVYQVAAPGDQGETGDVDIVWLDGDVDEIVIDDEVRDRLFLSTERYPICSDECAGICPICGRDRNERDCGCEEEVVDRRWDALRQVAGSEMKVNDSA